MHQHAYGLVMLCECPQRSEGTWPVQYIEQHFVLNPSLRCTC